MKDLLYNTYYGLSTGVIDGKIEDEDETLRKVREMHKNHFNIQVFGNDINPKEARSPLFRCRNLVANISCTFVGKDVSNIKASHISEAWHRTSNIGKDLVVIECITFNTGCAEVSDVLNALYNIVNHEAKKHFNASDVVVYWDLNDYELEIIKNNTDWCGNGTVNFVDSRYGYMILEQ